MNLQVKLPYTRGVHVSTISAWVWPYAGQPRRDIKFDFLFKFSFFSTCMGDPPGVTANVRNFKLLVRTVHTYT